ncbi:MAG: hypothetical protein WCO56_19635 [Verrucomicrobiota bacterium]
MTNYFTLLGEAPRPFVDGDALKSRFMELFTSLHPDRTHGASEVEKLQANQRYAELNAALNCLKEPRDRLLHLLELELGAKPADIQRIPPGTMELFMEVGQLCRDVDTFIAERGKVTSPMLKVQMFERGMAWTDTLTGLQQKINAKREELNQELRALNVVWESAPPTGPERLKALPLERLEQMYRVYSYIQRWTGQIQERVVQLAV